MRGESMAREQVILWVGRHRRRTWDEICNRYLKRIAKVGPVRERMVKSKGSGEGKARIEAEGRALLEATPDSAWIVALDRRGEQLSSKKLAELLQGLDREWPYPVAFLIGSDLGLDGAVLEQARTVLSLGPMTLSHELARVVLLEQLYRVASIRAGTKYHRRP